MSLLIARAAGLTALVAAIVTNAAEPGLSETRSSLEQWVETRQLISRTKSDWQTDRESLGQMIELFERELKSIAEERANVSTRNEQADIELRAAREEQSALNAGLDQMKLSIAGLERRVLALAPAFPPPLSEKLQPLIKRIPADADAAKSNPVERLQNVVAILGEVDRFNGTLSVVSEIRKNPSGAEVQVETIYIGLAQAFFVDKTGGYAGVGVPSADGWKWASRNELAARIQKSIAMYNNSTPAAFISLPIEIQ